MEAYGSEDRRPPMASRANDDRDVPFGSPTTKEPGRRPTGRRDPRLEEAARGFAAVPARQETDDDDPQFPRVSPEQDVPQRPLAERFAKRQ
jgi:hypothetical protein